MARKDNFSLNRVIERYHSITRRPDLREPTNLRILAKSFERILQGHLPADLGASILDVACGEGGLLLYLREKGYENLDGFDLSPENVNLCHEVGLHFVKQWDVLKIDSYAGTKKFDVIFAFDIIEHIAKSKVTDLLSKCYLKLRKGGYLVIQTPNMGSLLGWHMRYSDVTHEFGLTEKSIIDLLLTAGFEANKVSVYPSWNATTTLGYLREFYLNILHKLVFMSEDKSRPRIPTKNILAVAVK